MEKNEWPEGEDIKKIAITEKNIIIILTKQLMIFKKKNRTNWACVIL